MEYLDILLKYIPAITFIGGIVAFCVKMWKEMCKARDGDMCLLRKGMLDTYYRYKDTRRIPQYEAQNFKLMYDAYKARGGNSFIDEVNAHVTSWELEV